MDSDRISEFQIRIVRPNGGAGSTRTSEARSSGSCAPIRPNNPDLEQADPLEESTFQLKLEWNCHYNYNEKGKWNLYYFGLHWGSSSDNANSLVNLLILSNPFNPDQIRYLITFSTSLCGKTLLSITISTHLYLTMSSSDGISSPNVYDPLSFFFFIFPFVIQSKPRLREWTPIPKMLYVFLCTRGSTRGSVLD